MKIDDIKKWPGRDWVVEIRQYTLFGEIIKEKKKFDSWAQVCEFIERLKEEIIYFEIKITEEKRVIIKYQF